MFKFLRYSLVLILVNGIISNAHALTQEELQVMLQERIEGLQFFTKNAIFISAIQEQNRSGMTLDTIKSHDAAWIAGTSPLIEEQQNSKAGKYLKNIIVQQADVYNEAFLTDQQGANVAAYPATSDYWQGDETKFTAAFNGGTGKIFIGGVEWDESTQTNAVQISVPVEYGGQTIGVFVIGVKVSELEAEQMASATP